MNFHSVVRTICAVSAVVGATAASRAADEAERTVFWPPDFHGAQPPAPPVASPLDRFEFRGVMTIGANTFITLVDSTTRRALTAAVGETIDGVTLAGFQTETGSVLLTAGNQSRHLALPEAKIVALALSPHQPHRPPSRPLVVPQSNNPDGTRMRDVAREIHRRREMRRQMLEAQPSPVAPMPSQ